MKSLVIYSTRTGNTLKLARAVYETLPGEKELVPVTDVPPLDAVAYDLIVLGFPVMAARVEPRAKRFLASLDTRSRLFLVATHGSLQTSRLVQTVKKQALDLVRDVEVAGFFTCQGEVDPKVLRKLKRSATPQSWLDEAEYARGHPDAKDIDALTDLTLDISSSFKVG